MRSFICFFLFLCGSFIARGQVRQLSYYTGTEKALINDSKVDHSGNIVSVGNYLDTTFGDHAYKPFILKTNKEGYVIWFHGLEVELSWSFGKLEIARNGDYLVTAQGPQCGFYRADSNGTMVCMRNLTFLCNASGPLSVAELPDGRLVFCGQTCNSGSNPSYRQGIILFTDSIGSTIWQRAYRYDQWPAPVNYGFHDIKADSNYFYIVGEAYPQSHNQQHGLFIVMDYLGNAVRRNLIKYAPNASPPDEASFLTFDDINLFNGGIYVGGTVESATGLKQKFVMGKIDTVTETFTGNIISAGGYERFNSPKMHMYEEGNYYLVGTAKPNNTTTSKKYFISKIEGEDQVYTKKVTQDSIININSILSYNDTLVVSGYTKKHSSVYLATIAANVNTNICGIQDTTLAIDPFVRSVEDLFSWLDFPLSTSGGWWLAMDTLETYGILLCGDTICGNNNFNSLVALTDTTICQGETALLKYDNVGLITWYKNGTPIPFSGTELSVTQSGLYNVSFLTYDGCKDTSVSIYVNVLPAPIPVIQQNGDELISSPAVTYQWYAQGGILIPGANQQNFIPTVTGDYYVVVTDINGCSGTSAITYLQPSLVSNIGFNNNNILVYPNPVMDVVNIFNPLTQGIIIDIFDVSGRRVYSESLVSGYHSLKTAEMNLSGGVYMLKVRGGKVGHVQKIVIR